MTNQFQLTEEQEAIASSQAKKILVNAFAGASKTTTLVEYAKRRPKERLMYMAFNAAIKEEAKRKFPKNVRCVTSHGLAYPTFGTKYAHKLNNPRAYQVSEALGIDILGAGMVLETVTNYLASKEREIDERHAAIVNEKSKQTTGMLVDLARELWDMMQNTSSAMPIPHDGYLKLYHLTAPIVNTGTLLVDEYQDTNPTTHDFIHRQPANLVMVGDQYQSIYGFRGAVNTMENTLADEYFALTGSFRFGAGLASLATELLTDWRDCRRQIRGLGQHETVFSVDRTQPHAILSRTNAGLFAEAVALVQSNTPFSFYGGVSGYKVDYVLDSYRLFTGDRANIREAFIGAFADFEEMKKYGEALDDKEVKNLVKAVETYRGEIPYLVHEIKTRALPEMTGNEVGLGTTHKVKGMETKSVVLVDDFTELEYKRNSKGEEIPPDAEEVHILYVAMTRAMQYIELPGKVIDWLDQTGRLQHYMKGPRPVVAQPQTGQQAQAGNHAGKPSLDDWFAKMEAYFAKMHGAYLSEPEKAARVAEFLQRHATQFKAIS